MSIPVLPPAPQQTDPFNWRSRGDVFFPALTAFSVACNEFSTQLETARQDVLAAVNATLWATGAYTAGARVYDPTNGLLYLCLTGHTGTSGQYPSTQPARWALLSVAAPPLTVHSAATSSGSPYQLAVRQHVEIDHASQSWAQLPVSLAFGDWMWLGFVNGRYDNVIKGNGHKIMGVSEDFTVNRPYSTLLLRYLGAGFGVKVLSL